MINILKQKYIISAILKHSWFIEELNEKPESVLLEMKDILGVDVSSLKSKIKNVYFNDNHISLKLTVSGLVDVSVVIIIRLLNV